jgi:hypothetical protein
MFGIIFPGTVRSNKNNPTTGDLVPSLKEGSLFAADYSLEDQSE